MASITQIPHTQLLLKPRQFPTQNTHQVSFQIPKTRSSSSTFKSVSTRTTMAAEPMKINNISASADNQKKRYPGEAKGFAEEMRIVAMKLHTKDQSKEGEKEPESPPVTKWEPTIDRYLRFLVDSKLVYDKLEFIVDKAVFPEYGEFKNTGLERSECLTRDLEWFKEQGYKIPEPLSSSSGFIYSNYLEELSEKDPQAFISHFYTIYFAHSAGGRKIGKKVALKILDNKQLEFYKWKDDDLSSLLQNVIEKLNRVAEGWTREEKNHCLEETEISFKFSIDILRSILS